MHLPSCRTELTFDNLSLTFFSFVLLTSTALSYLTRDCSCGGMLQSHSVSLATPVAPITMSGLTHKSYAFSAVGTNDRNCRDSSCMRFLNCAMSNLLCLSACECVCLKVDCVDLSPLHAHTLWRTLCKNAHQDHLRAGCSADDSIVYNTHINSKLLVNVNVPLLTDCQTLDSES